MGTESRLDARACQGPCDAACGSAAKAPASLARARDVSRGLMLAYLTASCWSLPCPAWLSWGIESPWVTRIYGTQKTLVRIALQPGQRGGEEDPAGGGGGDDATRAEGAA